MGRPKKSEEEKKTISMRFRVTNDQKKQIERIAERLNLSEAKALRVLILEAENILNWRK